MDDVKLVPARMLLDKETIGAINFHCGDGGDNFGEHSDGLLWIGTVTDDGGKQVYGLHLATAEYPEEGSTTLVEFAEPLDAQRLRADTAEAGVQASVEVINSLHDQIAAEEQRIAELTELLREVQKTARKQAWAHGYPTLFANIDAALNPNPEAGSQ